MFAPRTDRLTNPPGEVTTRPLEGSIVETKYVGECGAETVAKVLAYTPEVLEQIPGTRWLLEMSEVTSAHVDARKPGGEILRLFRERGGERFAIVVPVPAIRMLITTVAFATGLPIRSFDTREQALAYLRS